MHPLHLMRSLLSERCTEQQKDFQSQSVASATISTEHFFEGNRTFLHPTPQANSLRLTPRPHYGARLKLLMCDTQVTP